MRDVDEAEVVAFYGQGWGLHRIAKKMHVGVDRVRAILVRNGVPIRQFHSSRGIDRGELAGLIGAGCTTTEIAGRLGVSSRAVRYAVVRFGLPAPRRSSRSRVAIATDDMVAWYRAGGTLDEVAREAGRSKRRVREELLAAGVVLRRRTARSGYPQLNDREWIEAHLKAGTPLLAMAREVGCDRWAVRSAIRRVTGQRE